MHRDRRIGGRGLVGRAADYKPSAFQGIAQRLRQDPSWNVVSMPCGHDVMVDLPHELADVLVAAT